MVISLKQKKIKFKPQMKMDFNIYDQVSKNKSTYVPILSSATWRNQNIQSNGRSRCVGDQF